MAAPEMGSVLLPSGGTWKMHRIVLLQVFMVTFITAELPPDNQFFEGLIRTACNTTTDRAFGWFEDEGTPCNYEINASQPIKFSCETFSIPEAADGSCLNGMKFEEDGEAFQVCGDHYPARVFRNVVRITVVITEEGIQRLDEEKNKDSKPKGEKGGKSKRKRPSNKNRGGRVKSERSFKRGHRSVPGERKQTPERKRKSPGGPGKSLRNRGERKRNPGKGKSSKRKPKGIEQRKKNDKKDKDSKQNTGFGYRCVWQPEYPYDYFYNYYYYTPWDGFYFY